MEQPSGNKGHLGSKFEDFEYAPRNDVWDRIEGGSVGKDMPGALGPVFSGFEHTPQGRVWGRIVREMYPFRRRRAAIWWSVAAGVAVVVAFMLSRPYGAGEQDMGQLARTEKKGFKGMENEGPRRGDFAAENLGEQEGGAVEVPENRRAGDAQENGGGRNVQRGNGYAAVENQVVKRLPNKSGMRVEKMPLALTSWKAENGMRDVEIDWDAVMASDTVALEGMAELGDSAVEEVPYYDEFDFEDEDEVRYARLETQLGSNISPGRSSDALASRPYFAIPDRDGFALANEDFVSAETHRSPESFNTPLSLGAGVSKRIKRRWSVGMGFLYTLMTSTSRYDNEEWETNTRIRRQYLGPNLNLQHEFIQRKKISMFSIAGLQYDFGIGARAVSTDFRNGEQVDEVQSKFQAGRQAAVMAGLGMNYHLTPNLRLYMQGTGNHYFHQTMYNLWSEKRLWPNVQAGIRLGL